MPLSDEQKARLEAAARQRGIDPAKLIAAAEGGAAPKPTSSPESETSAAKEKPNLYMYLLPFVTVNEVRTIWLDLDPVVGGDEYAAAFAAKQTGAPSTKLDDGAA